MCNPGVGRPATYCVHVSPPDSTCASSPTYSSTALTSRAPTCSPSYSLAACRPRATHAHTITHTHTHTHTHAHTHTHTHNAQRTRTRPRSRSRSRARARSRSRSKSRSKSRTRTRTTHTHTHTQAVLLNERGAEQKMVSMVERRGVVVAKLLDQTSAAGRDSVVSRAILGSVIVSRPRVSSDPMA